MVCNYFTKLFVDLELEGCKGQNKTKVARKKIIFDFFFQLKFIGLLLQVSKHNMS